MRFSAREFCARLEARPVQGPAAGAGPLLSQTLRLARNVGLTLGLVLVLPLGLAWSSQSAAASESEAGKNAGRAGRTTKVMPQPFGPDVQLAAIFAAILANRLDEALVRTDQLLKEQPNFISTMNGTVRGRVSDALERRILHATHDKHRL